MAACLLALAACPEEPATPAGPDADITTDATAPDGDASVPDADAPDGEADADQPDGDAAQPDGDAMEPDGDAGPETDAGPTSTVELLSTVDPLLYDLAAETEVFDYDRDQAFGANPTGYVVPLGAATDIEANLTANLDFLVAGGQQWVYVTVLDGFGNLWFDSPTLLPLSEAGVDYDGQYTGADPDGDLAIPEEDAYSKYVLIQDLLGTIVTESHARGLKVVANIESLAHIINRATGQGIGGSSDALILAGNLPVPDLTQFAAVIAEILATGADAVFAEAYQPDYDAALASALETAGIEYWHTGADLGTTWVGYYYSLYPADHDEAKSQRTCTRTARCSATPTRACSAAPARSAPSPRWSWAPTTRCPAT